MNFRLRLLLSFALAALISNAVLAYWTIHTLTRQEQTLSASQVRMIALEQAFSLVKDAEAGQRGYLITGDERYLAPYQEAIGSLDGALSRLNGAWPASGDALLRTLDDQTARKREEMRRTIELRRQGKLAAADAMVRAGIGQQHMENIRATISALRSEEDARLADAMAAAATARSEAFASTAFASVVAIISVLACVGLLRRDLILRTASADDRAELLRREREARTAAETANHAKDDFLATLSHELRNPLHAIVGWIQILKGRPDDPSIRTRAMDTVERNSRSLQRMIEDLLDASRATRGKLEISTVPTPMAVLVEAVLETMRPTAAAKQVAIDGSIEATGTVVDGDYDRLAQVIINIVSNAIKFTPAGGRVRVDVTRVDADAVVTVTDTGPGIARDSLPVVFEPFRQVGARVVGPEGGLGLGLAIARHIVELHGGTIGVESDGPGTGARFTVRIPALPVGAEAEVT